MTDPNDVASSVNNTYSDSSPAVYDDGSISYDAKLDEVDKIITKHREKTGDYDEPYIEDDKILGVPIKRIYFNFKKKIGKGIAFYLFPIVILILIAYYLYITKIKKKE